MSQPKSKEGSAAKSLNDLILHWDDLGNQVYFAEDVQQLMDTPPKHVHQFVIPVEWETSADLISHFHPDRGNYVELAEVIKLRCACGEEVER